MSDFLLNLALRSAGLGTIVTAQPPLSEDAGHIEQADGANAEIADRAVPTPAPYSNAADFSRPSPAAATAQPIATAPVRAIQREMLSNAAATAMPATPPYRTTAIPPVMAPSPRPAAPDTPGHPLVAKVAATEVAPANVTLFELPEPVQSAPAVTLIPMVRPDEATPLPGPGLPETAAEIGTDKWVLPTERVEPPVPVMIELVPAAASTIVMEAAGSKVKEMPEPAERRSISVQIGVIEIQTDAPAAASAPVPARAVTAAPQPSGFEQFARLRGYAPWQW